MAMELEIAEEGERERERETKASFEYRGHLVVVLVGLLLLLGNEHWNKKSNHFRNQYTKVEEPHRPLEERAQGEEDVKVKFEDLIDENFTIGSPEASRAREGGSRRGNPIPQKLHFTWKTEKLEELPEMFSTFQNRWRALHPSWEIKIWSDADQLDFVRRHYGDDTYWAALWSSSSARWFGVTPVMKADIFRYMLMETHGGVYSDMDVEPLRSLDALVDVMGRPQCILGQEPLEHAVILEGKRHFVCNAVLASVPGHPLWSTLLEEIRKDLDNSWGWTRKYLLNLLFPNPVGVTGPRKLTKVVEDNRELLLADHPCSIVKPHVFYPSYDTSADLDSKCSALFRKAERLNKEVTKDQIEACERVKEKEKEEEEQQQQQHDNGSGGESRYPASTWAVHHWTHTWIGKHSSKFESHTVH